MVDPLLSLLSNLSFSSILLPLCLNSRFFSLFTDPLSPLLQLSADVATYEENVDTTYEADIDQIKREAPVPNLLHLLRVLVELVHFEQGKG